MNKTYSLRILLIRLVIGFLVSLIGYLAARYLDPKLAAIVTEHLPTILFTVAAIVTGVDLHAYSANNPVEPDAPAPTEGGN